VAGDPPPESDGSCNFHALGAQYVNFSSQSSLLTVCQKKAKKRARKGTLTVLDNALTSNGIIAITQWELVK